MSDLAALFAKDPLDLTDEDIDKIIAEYSSRRSTFNLTGKAPAKTKKASESATNLKSKLDLGGLGL